MDRLRAENLKQANECKHFGVEESICLGNVFRIIPEFRILSRTYHRIVILLSETNMLKDLLKEEIKNIAAFRLHFLYECVPTVQDTGQVKSAYQIINFLISRPKHMLWVLKRTVSMRLANAMPRLIG